MSLKTILKEKELWFLILLGLLFFYRPLFLGETFFFRDLYIHDLLDKQVLVDFIHTREWPLWDPYQHGGRPYLANIINFVFYPSNVLYFFLPLIRAFNLNIVLHFLGCSFFAYVFSRVTGLRPISSFITGVVYGFCGYTLSLGNILNRIMAMPYIPLLLLFWHLWLLEGKRKWFVMTVIAGVIQVFTGAPETNIFSLLLLLGWSLVYPYPHRSICRKIVLWLLLGIFIVGISSVQILPTIEVVSQASRGTGLEYAAFACWSLSPRRFAEFVFPGFLGYADILPREEYYWGRNLVDEGFPYIISIYFGWVAAALAFVGGIHRNNKAIFPFRARILLLSLCILSLFLSLGHLLPFFFFLYQHTPFIAAFRYPIKFLIIGIFPFALLVGYTSEVHFGSSMPGYRSSDSEALTWCPSSKFLIILWGILTILLIFTIMFLLSNNFANQFQKFFFGQSGSEVSRRGLGFSFMHALAIWLLMVLLYQYRRMKKRSWQHVLLACILVLDLFSAGKGVNFYAPEELFTYEPSIIPIVRNEIGDGRLYRVEQSSEVDLRVPSENIFHMSPENIIWGARWEIEILNWYLAALYRIPVIFHRDITKLAHTRLMSLRTFMESLPWEQRLPFLSAGGVTMIITSEDISIPGIQHITEIPNWSDVSFHLYRNEIAAARVEFVTTWEHAVSDHDVLRAMLNPSYDPRKQVVLQEPESTLFDIHFKTIESKITDSNPSKCTSLSQIKKLRANTHKALFSVSNSCDGYLVFSESFYPGWKVSVDGKPTSVLRANYAFSAVYLPAGVHEVKRFYRPTSLLVGVLSSAMFCCVLLLITYNGKFLYKVLPIVKTKNKTGYTHLRGH